jgi:hypothetical protein
MTRYYYAPRGVKTWDPTIDLPTLLWLVHPDDATDIISNEINSIPDRVNTYNFAALASTNRIPLNTSIRPGHQIASSLATVEWLICSDATLAQDITSVSNEYTIFSFHNYEANSLRSLVGHSNTNTAGATGASIFMRKAAGPGANLRTASGGASTDYTWVAADGYTGGVNNWESWVFTHDSSGNVSFYLNGVFVSTKSGTVRNPVGLLYTYFSAGGDGSASTEVHHGPKGVCTGLLNSSEIALLHAWLVSNS